MFDTTTYEKFNVAKPSSLNHLVMIACEYGLVDFFEQQYSQIVPYLHRNFSLYLAIASTNRHISILEWLKKSKLEMEKNGSELRYDRISFESASEKGYIDILDWWRNSGLQLFYTNQAIIDAS